MKILPICNIYCREQQRTIFTQSHLILLHTELMLIKNYLNCDIFFVLLIFKVPVPLSWFIPRGCWTCLLIKCSSKLHFFMLNSGHTDSKTTEIKPLAAAHSVSLIFCFFAHNKYSFSFVSFVLLFMKFVLSKRF